MKVEPLAWSDADKKTELEKFEVMRNKKERKSRAVLFAWSISTTSSQNYYHHN
jgi:hypothetical protein